MGQAAKVGLLVIGFFAMLVGAYFALGRSFFEPKTIPYKAMFADAGGISTGSRVLLSGVNVGQVSSVKLISAGQAEVVLAVRDEITIPQGTEAVISTSLVGIGDRPVELIPPLKPAPQLEKNGIIKGKVKGALEGIIPDTSETFMEMNKTLQSFRRILDDQSMKKNVNALLENTNTTVEQFGKLAARIDDLAAKNQGTVTALLNQAMVVMQDAQKTSHAVAEMANDPKLSAKLNQILDGVNSSIAQSQALMSSLQSTVDDPEMKNSIKQILENTKTMTDSGTRIAANAETMTANGTVLSAKAIEIADKASILADKAGVLADDLHKLIEKFGGSLSGAAKTAIGMDGVDARFIRETKPARFRSEIEAGFHVGEARYYVGLWDAFESNKIIAQQGRPLTDKLELRYGVYASQLGLGVHYLLAPGVTIRGDIFDVNDPRFDLRARFSVGKDYSAWVGLDRVFGGTRPSIGFGIKR